MFLDTRDFLIGVASPVENLSGGTYFESRHDGCPSKGLCEVHIALAFVDSIITNDNAPILLLIRLLRQPFCSKFDEGIDGFEVQQSSVSYVM